MFLSLSLSLAFLPSFFIVSPFLSCGICCCFVHFAAIFCIFDVSLLFNVLFNVSCSLNCIGELFSVSLILILCVSCAPSPGRLFWLPVHFSSVLCVCVGSSVLAMFFISLVANCYRRHRRCGSRCRCLCRLSL